MTTADKAIAFISKLRNPDKTEWAGKPFVLLDWEREYIQKLLRTDKGRRVIRKSFLFIPKKNGKTTLLAALATFFLFFEKGGQIFLGSNDKEQASLLYRMVASIIQQNPWLASQCRVYKGNVRKIECRYSGSELVVGSSEAFTKNGLNVSIAIFDECGFFESSELLDAIESSMIGRSQPLIIGISTAGSDNQSYGYKLYEQTKAAIADPESFPDFLGIIFEGNANKWQDVEEWYRCNPSMRELGNESFIRATIASAKKNPSDLRRILRYHLNVWASDDSAPWIDIGRLSKDVIDVATLHTKPAYVGIDLASRNDFSCVCLLIPLPEGKYFADFHYFTPSDTLASREHSDKAPYGLWRSQNLITAVPGDFMDSSPVFDHVKALAGRYRLKGIGLDAAHNASDLTSNLQTTFGPSLVRWVSQGWKTVVPATREIEALIMQGKLFTNDNPVFRWNVGNVRCKVADDAGNLMPSKKKSTSKIDGVYALIDALSLEMADRQKSALPTIMLSNNP